MIVTLNSLEDFTLASFAAISRDGASARISDTALARIRERRTAFVRLIDTVPTPWIYNVTGKSDGTTLDAHERRALSRRYIAAGAVLFIDETRRREELPRRIVRGALFCRLANFIEGHAAVRAEVVLAVAAMIDTPFLPIMPRLGHGAAGEMSLLSHLFGDLIERMTLEEKEALALINGAPVAATLMADSLLSAGPLLLEIVGAVAAAIDAYPAPPEAYDPALASLWRNPHAAQALSLIAGARVKAESSDVLSSPASSSQAPVSFRAAPRLLGRALRSYASLRFAAEHAIRAVTDNPVVVDGGGSLRVLSNGGFFDADAPALFDELAGVYADLARLLEKLGTRLAEKHGASLAPSLQARLRGLVGALAGYAEDGVSTATRTPIPGTEGGGGPQNDLISPVVQAWAKQMAAGEVLSRSVATLRAVLAGVKGGVDVEPRSLDESLRDRMASGTGLLAEAGH
jgi:histidine ammonia-lyase